VFSSDALSSVAYATEEILLVLAVAATYAHDSGPFFYVLPISLVIAVLLWLVTSSYRQTIHAYPSGGGAYIVAKENLGTTAGLTAAAALLVDYVLTVSVSVAAGVGAITSAAQGTDLAWLAGHRATLCVGMIALVALANLRGIRESGRIFAVPTYLFLFSFLGMIAWGLGHYALNPGTVAIPAAADPKQAEGYVLQPLSLLLLLGAFANGCTALTGVEAISNGRTGLPPAGVAERRHDAVVDGDPAHGHVSGHQRAGLLVHGRAASGRDGYLAVRPHHFCRPAHEMGLLSRANIDGGDSGAGREHLVRRLPAPGGPDGPRSLPAATVHERGRPAGLLQRHPPPGLLLGAVGVDLQR